MIAFPIAVGGRELAGTVAPSTLRVDDGHLLVDGERRSLEIEPLPFDIRSDEWYRVETVVDGDRIVTSVNGTEVDVTESDAIAAGTVGFREVGTESARFDDVRVETLDGDLLFESSFDDASALDAFARFIDPTDVVAVPALPLRDGEPSLDGVVDLTGRFEAGETWSAPDGEFLVESYVRQHHGGTYLDLMSGEAVGQYLDVVHGEYYRRFGNEFGSTVRGFWDDEPVLAEFGTAVPWSPSLPAELESLEEPFFLAVSYVEPHYQNDMWTFVAPDKYAAHHKHNPYVPPDLQERPGDWFQELPDYYGIIERVDECVDRLLSTLNQKGLKDDTVIAFTSDHGCHFRTRPGEYKRTVHESAVRVPAIISGPGFDRNRTIERVTSVIDIPATLLDAAGLRVPDDLHGESLLPIVEGERQDAGGEAFI